MKIRNGFISNSSSTAFILDARIDGTQEYLKCAKHLFGYIDCGRGSTLCLAEGVRNYARANMDCKFSSYHAQWLFEQILELGDNLIFLRISDEEMGGWCPSPPEKLIVSGREWH